ncbi:MAG: hypothetical protein OXI03_00610 [Chloroflexota bacterium]|nr:hypothetical protein [Chloroflexota bacterium]
MRKRVRLWVPAFKADARAGRDRDAKSTPLTAEQFEATLYRALFVQTVVIIVALTLVMLVLMSGLLAAFT